ncbi:hypothetical protein ZTR_08159 [Talaromyces verruculosus]|nr:hypothetical protein ZTR_08159 [Talaromyces verruculosus]
MSTADENVTATPPPSRPYRSHKFPACDFCRTRKSRCTQQSLDQPCVECVMHRVACSRISLNSEASIPTTAERGRKRRRVSSKTPASRRQSLSPAEASTAGDHPPLPLPFTPNDASKTQSTHIVGPAMARDAQVLESYMSPAYNTAASRTRPNPYSVYSHDPRNPVVYMKVPRHRNIAPSGNGTAGFRQYEAMEKIVEPLGPELCSVYFDNIHPPFPILDEKAILEAYPQEGLPYTLAISATGRPTPDIRYMWNLAVSAMNDDFVAPDLSTVLSCILDLLGRPTTSITYNAINVGRVVALAQSLGLNRNPMNWDLAARQKNLRIRTWWGILIHDQWASLSHGTPPHIHRSQWDVPVPDLDKLGVDSITDEETTISVVRVQGALSFIALCRLTMILGEILPLIYTLQPQDPSHALRALRRHETALDEWEEKLSTWLRPASASFDRKAPGALNLQLCYLVIKMCLWRTGLLELHRLDATDVRDDKAYYQSKCRKAACAVIELVTSLERDELDAFWLPYTTYHLNSATTLILRCALEAENPETAQECVASAKSLIDFLRKAKDETNWDLADTCLNHCEAVVENLGDRHNLATWRKNPPGNQKSGRGGGESGGTFFPPSRKNHYPQGQQTGATFSNRSHESSNLDPEIVGGGRDGINQGVIDPMFFQEVMAFGSIPGSMADNSVFSDMVQMPYLEGYPYRNFY